MKISKSKRILAVFLSILMVITSIPVVAFTAFAADDSDVTAVENAMTEYEKKMDGTVYKEMSKAYEAYVACQAALDAYRYGAVTDALNGKAAALTSATTDMVNSGTWSRATAKASVENRDNTDVASADYAKSILYAEKSASMAEQGNEKSVIVQLIGSPNTVILYDGTDALIPIFSFWFYDQTGFSSRQMLALYPTNNETSGRGTDNNDLQLQEAWHGDLKNGTGDWNGAWRGGAKIGCYNASLDLYTQATGGNRNAWNRQANYLKYVGGTSGFTNGLKTVSPGWYAMSNQSKGKNEVTKYFQNVGKYYIIDYASFLNAYNAKLDLLKEKAAAVSSYKQGGLSSLFAAYDLAQSDNANPNSSKYDYSSDVAGKSAEVAGYIANATTALNNATVGTADADSGYQAIRDAMTADVINTFNAGSEGYKEDSWKTFENAYTAARDAMANTVTNGYNASNAATLGKNLADSYPPELTAPKQNTDALMTVINDFEALNNIFTSESYSAVAEVVKNAKIAIWGSEDKYGVATAGPDESEQAAKDIADQVALVTEAVKTLRISPATVVETTYGRYSLDEVIAIEVDGTLYKNYTDYATAVATAVDFRNRLNTAEFTDYNTQLADYLAAVQAVLDAYHQLTYAFTSIPDGTVTQNSSTKSITPLTAQDQGYQYVTFSYTDSAVILNMTHETKNVTFGNANIGFGTNIKSRPNNMLDSITIHATASPISDGKRHITANGYTDTPDALTDSQRSTYAGQLAYNGFELTNLRWTGKTSNNAANQIMTLSDGTKITDVNQAKAQDLTETLGRTDGTGATDLNYGGVFVKANNSDAAYTYVDADFNVTVKPNAEVKLTKATTPKLITYRLNNTYFGAVTGYNCQNTAFYAGYNWLTSEQNSEKLNSVVYVVDISYLVDLVKVCDGIVAAGALNYTADSWETFKEALKAAKEDMDYNNLSYSDIVRNCQTRYTNLWDAYQALTVKDVNVTFAYKDADGNDTSTVITMTEGAGKPLSNIQSQIEAIVVPEYSANGYTYTFKSWNPVVDYSYCPVDDVTYTATYDSFSSVDWSVYNTAQTNLINALLGEKYTVEGLNAIKAEVAKLAYFTLSETDKGKTGADQQDAVNAEAKVIDSITAMLPQYIADSSAYDALSKSIDVINADAYDATKVQEALANAETSTDVEIGGATYKGYEFDSAIATVMSAMNDNAYKYTVIAYDIDDNPYYLTKDGTYVQGTGDSSAPVPPAGREDIYFHYGDAVTATNPVDASKACTFEVTVIANKTDVESNSKYIGTTKEYQFNVRGNTSIFTSAGDTTNTYTVRFVDGRNNNVIYETVTSNAIFSLRSVSLQAVPFYTLENYTDQAAGKTYTTRSTVTLTSQVTTLVANYTASSEIGNYTIIVQNEGGAQIDKQTAAYNEKVTVEAPGATALVDTATGKVVAYGSTYSFYACQDLTLKAVSSETTDVQVSVVKPVITDDIVYFIGQFAAPEGTTIKGQGIVIDTNGINKNLTLKDVDSASQVYNMSVSKLTCGNQFTAYAPINNAAGSMVTYVAYVIYVDAYGNEQIAYSNVVEAQLS